MLEARIRIKYPEIVEKYFPEKNSLSLSLEHIMKYSYYNQGCDGGYAYLTLKFFHEFELLHSKCFDDTDSKYESKCQDPKLEELVLSVKNYYYVGGSYGKCSEHAIMEEVRKNGPIVVSFEPDYSFMFYSHGIYQAPDRDSWVTKKISKPEWQKVDHSVVLVGWGVEKGQKYWLIQNSWGPDWGDGGYLKFLRGEDHLGIESICEVGTPMVLVKKPKQ